MLFRSPYHLNPELVYQKFREEVLRRTDETCLRREDVVFDLKSMDWPARSSYNNEFVKARAEAYEEVYGVKPDIAPIGATEPIVPVYNKRGVPVSFDSGDTFTDNAHAREESIQLKELKRGIKVDYKTLKKFSLIRRRK